MKNDLFIFDIDGTLINSAKSYLQVIINAFGNMGIEKIDTDFNNYLHHTDSWALQYNYEQNFNESFDTLLFEQLDVELEKELNKQPRSEEILGASAFINALKKNKTPFAFATGAFPKPTKIKMQQANIWYDEPLLITSKTSITREGMVLQAIEAANHYFEIDNNKNIISVGDGLWDLQTANNLGIDFIGIGTTNKEILLDHGCKKWFENIKTMQQHYNVD